MPPKQATLGKFFGNPKGSKAPGQQSTLAFNRSKNSKAKNEDEGDEDDVVPPTKKRKVSNTIDEEDNDGDIVMEDGTATEDAAFGSGSQNGVDEQDSDRLEAKDASNHRKASSIKGQALAKSLSSKSKEKLEESNVVRGEEEDEDEEPVTKRRRRGIETSEARNSSEKSESKPATAQKEPKTSKTEEKHPRAPKTPSESSKPLKSSKSTSAHKSDTTKSSTTSKASKVEPDPEEAPAKDEASASEEDEDDAESEEEDKPEVAAKAREKVQATLKGSGKDPYPDWKPGEPVPYAALCTTFSLIEMTTKRLIISSHCSLFLRQVLRLTPDDLLPTVQLMINKLAADYAGIELGIGESLIMKAIGETTGRSLSVIKADQNQIGDLGLVAAKSRSNQPTMFKPKPLTIRGVLDGLMGIAIVSGHGSQDKKIAGIKKLLSAADTSTAGKGSKAIDITKDKGGASETKFIIRFLEGKLRLGLAEKTILVALAHAMVIHETEKKGNKVPSSDALTKGEAILKTVFSELPSYEVIVPAMLEHGIFHLRENCKLQPGVPLKPMLAKPTKSITEVLDRFEGKTFTCEYKYDGERAQIHYVAQDSPQQYASSVPVPGKSAKGLSAIFSRNSEDLSKKYPDILEKLHTWIRPETKSFVLDCETVAWDLKEKKVLPFQQLMTRKRKDVKSEEITVKVCVFAFDMLFYNDEAVVEKSLRQRRELLHEAFTEVESEFSFAQYGDTSELEEIQILLDESVKASCEGLMVKMLDTDESGYEPSKRSRNWLKVKKDYLSGVGDSLDLVVLGAYYGKGKRTSVYGAFLLACYNSSKQIYETVCNIGTGFSEAILEELHSKLSDVTIDKPKPFYSHSTVTKDQPDVWFEPRFVWEVKTADLTLSPRYKAGADALNDVSGKGISLRFPRFIKEREDKKTEQATESRMVVEMYQKQESVGKNKGPSVDDDFEY
ncbi:SH3 domain-containing protein C23A1.17 [Physcia stellaris]|nr:SH3 domain-containing protein C23A1.17 [Physcia stellaris]